MTDETTDTQAAVDEKAAARKAARARKAQARREAVAASPATSAEGIPFAGDPHLIALTPEAVEHAKALEKEYSQYVAAVDIPYGSALAYAEGTPVPASNVKRWRYDELGLVHRVGTKGAEASIAKLAANRVTTPADIKAPGDD